MSTCQTSAPCSPSPGTEAQALSPREGPQSPGPKPHKDHATTRLSCTSFHDFSEQLGFLLVNQVASIQRYPGFLSATKEAETKNSADCEGQDVAAKIANVLD